MADMPTYRTAVPIALLLALGVFLPGPPAANADGDFESARKTYEERRRRPSFFKRTEGRRVLVATEDPRAIQILARDYAKPEPPREEVRHTIVATVLGQSWGSDDAKAAIHAWRAANATPADAWLWYRSLLADMRNLDDEDAVAAYHATTDPHLREAAVRALAAGRYTEIFAVLQEQLAGLVDKRMAWRGPQARVLESVALCLASLKLRHERDGWKETAKQLLERLGADGILRRTKYVVTRAMAHVMGGDPTVLDQDTWIREVLAGGSGAGAEDRRYGGPSFGGLRATGERIVYVIDLSDSMLEPIDDKVKERLRAVVTGPRDPKDGSRPDLPWHRINTRFDLAREMLKASIQELDKKKLFAVVAFGNEARTLAATPKLRKATPGQVKKTLAEIDGITPGPPGSGTTASRLGALEGETNLHGGLRLAFQLSTKGVQRKNAWLDPKMRDVGAETIFLLTDGEPTVDDWITTDRRDGEGAVRDRETNEPTDLTDTLRFAGPYGYLWGPYLVDDIARRNFFRHVEIHCIGLGDAAMSLLHELADVGLGKATQIGHE